MYINEVRIEVGLYIIGQSGVQQECNSPLFKVEKKTDVPTGQELAQGSAGIPARRNARTADQDLETALNPAIYARSVPLSIFGIPVDILREYQPSANAKIHDCRTVTQKVADLKTITLPYSEVEGDCEMQVWPITRDYNSRRSNYIVRQTVGLTDDCKDTTNTYVGFVQERAGPFVGLNYHRFFGKFCGRFTGAFDPVFSVGNIYEPA